MVGARAKALVLAAALVVSAGQARADAITDEARALLEELRYEEAYEELSAGWQAGRAEPDELRTVFRLLGELAAVLGDGEAARGHFARLLSLDPDAELPEGTSPKITRWLEEARADLAGAGSLAVGYRVKGPTLEIVVHTDPLDLIAGAVATIDTGSGVHRVEVDAAGGLELPVPDASRVEVSVSVVDQYGNRLLAVIPSARPIVIDQAPPAPEPGAAPARKSRPLYAHWAAWGALSAGLGVAGGAFAVRANRAQDAFDRLAGESRQHEAADALAAERHLRRQTLYANIGFGAALACGAAAALLAVTGGDEDAGAGRAALAPAAYGQGAGLSFAIVF